MRSTRYDLYGAAVGVGLPVLGTALEAWTRAGTVAPAALAAAFAGQPLLWIMATTPIVLGGLGRLLVRQHDEIVRQSLEIVRLEQARRESFQRTASELFGAAQGLLGTASAFTRTASTAAGRARETSATLRALGHSASAASLTAESVIGLAISADRAVVQGRRDAGAASAALLQRSEEVRDLAARVEALDADLAAVVAAAGPIPADAPLAVTLTAARRTMGGAVELARGSAARAAEGAETATRTAETVQELAAALTAAARAAREIARVAQQQEGGIEEAQKTVAGIVLDTEEVGVAIREVEKEARLLTDLATALRRAVKSGGDAEEAGAGGSAD
jgi:hypothetical protein